MAIYRVHVSEGLDPLNAADKARFVREGFVFWALVFGPLWLLATRQWLALGMWVLAAALVAIAISAGMFPPDVGCWLYGLGALYLGFEGRAIVSAGLERSGARLVDVATGADRRAAERAFFSRWSGLGAAGASAPRAGAPATAPQTIIGLFPEAGG
jgi:hypothetical protein